MSRRENDSPEGPGPWELAVVVVLLIMGGYMIWQGVEFGVGSVRRMGPGFFPVGVGALLVLLSLAILFEVRRGGAGPLELPLRPIVLITVGLLAFAATVGPLGIVPSTVLLVLIGSFADTEMTALRAGISAVALAAIGYLVFIVGFGLPLEPFWW